MVFVLMGERAVAVVAKHFSLLTHIFKPLLTEPQDKFNNSYYNIQIEESGENRVIHSTFVCNVKLIGKKDKQQSKK